MLSRKAYRDLIRATIREHIRARPGCAIVTSIGVDPDTELTFISFLCLNHDATWRDYIDETPDTHARVDSPCPVVRDLDGEAVPPWTPEEDPPEGGSP